MLKDFNFDLLSLGIGLGYPTGQKAKQLKPGKTFNKATCLFVSVGLRLSLSSVVFVFNLCEMSVLWFTEVKFMLAFVCMKSHLPSVLLSSAPVSVCTGLMFNCVCLSVFHLCCMLHEFPSSYYHSYKPGS